MQKIIIIIIIAVAIVVGGGVFYGGIKYEQSKNSQGKFSQADFQNLSLKERQQRMQKLGANTENFRNKIGGQQGNGFVSGEILSKDNKSITIKLKNGGSKLSFLLVPLKFQN